MTFLGQKCREGIADSAFVVGDEEEMSENDFVWIEKKGVIDALLESGVLDDLDEAKREQILEVLRQAETKIEVKKTVTVEITQSIRHPRYDKVVRSRKRFNVHDDANDAKLGDTVRIAETRPLSKTKRWRVAEILEKAK